MMDALGDLLEPYSQTIGSIAGTITLLQFLSGAVLLIEIRNKGSSDAYPVEPFLGGIVLTVLNLKLGMLMGDPAMIQVNVIGFAINAVFMVGFYYYASNASKSQLWIKTGYASLFLMAIIAYANFEDPEIVEYRLGLLITGILLWLVGSPLLQINKFIKAKSTEGLPFPIILAGNLVAGSWLLYGLSIRNSMMVYQSLFLFVLGSIQLSLFVIYPSTPAKQQPSKKAAKASKKDN